MAEIAIRQVIPVVALKTWIYSHGSTAVPVKWMMHSSNSSGILVCMYFTKYYHIYQHYGKHLNVLMQCEIEIPKCLSPEAEVTWHLCPVPLQPADPIFIHHMTAKIAIRQVIPVVAFKTWIYSHGSTAVPVKWTVCSSNSSGYFCVCILQSITTSIHTMESIWLL